jgi:hypothetical protein
MNAIGFLATSMQELPQFDFFRVFRVIRGLFSCDRRLISFYEDH